MIFLVFEILHKNPYKVQVFRLNTALSMLTKEISFITHESSYQDVLNQVIAYGCEIGIPVMNASIPKQLNNKPNLHLTCIENVSKSTRKKRGKQ